MDEPMAEPSTGRSRSFGGCATCRNRHMKCDEGRPSCSICKNAGLVCGGYEKNIFFDFEDAPEPGSLRFRRPLLTEEERKSMSAWLTSTVPSRLVNQSLSQIDEECEESSVLEAIQISRGPFGAFRLLSTLESSEVQSGSTPTWFGSARGPNDVLQGPDEYLFPPNAPLSPGTQQLIQTIFDQPQQEPLPPFFDMLDITAEDGRIEEIFDDGLMPSISTSSFTHEPQIFQFPPFSSGSQISPYLTCSPRSIIAAASNTVPQDAVFLLKHYQATVLRLLTPFRHSKTPWHILFIPHAKNCLAALTLGETIDHASLCSFYGILAISAYSLGGVSHSSTWLDQGKRYKQKAREHANLMLQTSYNIPKTAKYKSILMALLTMVQISIVIGNRDQTECDILETEKFIRLRGLNRKKSRKVRLLHHCYAFERILYESTFLGGQNTNHRHHVREAVKTSGLVIYGQDSISFRLRKWSNLAQDMMRVKGQEEGENDLHLEYPGIWSATLYPEIFGVPEMWLFLVSLVIRLAREKDAAEQEGATDTLSAKDFLGRAKAIEKCINQMRRPARNPDDYAGQVLENMLDAMQHALSIYFYRKIYDVESDMLQQKVETVRDCLLRCDSTDPDEVYGTARLVWPAFIAASEAKDPEVQASFAAWFKSSAQWSGLRLFSDTLERLEHIWQERR